MGGGARRSDARRAPASGGGSAGGGAGGGGAEGSVAEAAGGGLAPDGLAADGLAQVRPYAAIVYNPTKVDVRRLRPQVAKIEAERGWAPSLWAETTLDDPGEAAGARMLGQTPAPSVLIAVGGDGTVSAVAQALAPQRAQTLAANGSQTHGSGDGRATHSSLDVPLGILPAGTTNLFARALGLPLRNREKALRAAFSDTVRSVDIGRVDARLESGETISRAFVVMAGMGVDAQMVVNTSSRGKSALGWTGYIAAIVGSFVTNRRFDLSYTLDSAQAHDTALDSARRHDTALDGAQLEGVQRHGVVLDSTALEAGVNAAAPAVASAAPAPAHTIVVGNAGGLPAGIRMIPGARIDDGLLDVVVLRPLGFSQWAQAVGWFVRTNTPALPRRAAGRAAADGSAPVVSVAVTHARATAISWSAGPAQDFEIDGEHLGRVTSADASISPAALRVRGSVAP